MASIAEIRKQYPDYGDLSDQQLADALHQKHYADIPKAEFYAKVGLGAAAPAAAAPSPVAAPARKPSPIEGAVTKPLAGAGRTDILGRGLQLGDQLLRTYGGAAADLADGVTGMINRPANALLSAFGVDAQLPVDQLGPRVAEPVGAIPQFTRDITPYVTGAAGVGRGLATLAPKAAAAAGAIRTGIVAGAPIDAALSTGQDRNLGNMIEELGGPRLPTARVEGENPGIAALKDMAEGGVLGAGLELGLKYAPQLLPGGAPRVSAEDALVAAARDAEGAPSALVPEEIAPVAQAPDMGIPTSAAPVEAAPVVAPAEPRRVTLIVDGDKPPVVVADEPVVAEATAGGAEAPPAGIAAPEPATASALRRDAKTDEVATSAVPATDGGQPQAIGETSTAPVSQVQPEGLDTASREISGTARLPAQVEPSRDLAPEMPQQVQASPVGSQGMVEDVPAPRVQTDAPIQSVAPAAVSDEIPATLPESSATPKLDAPALKTPDEAPAPKTEDASEVDADAFYQRHFGPGAKKLYSNPLDPDALKEHLADPAVRLIKREIDGIKEGVEQIKKDFSGVRAASSVDKTLHSAATTVRKVWYSNTAAIRAMADRYPNAPEIREIADHIGTDPGRGRKVDQTYERAVQMRASGMANRTGNILGDKVKPEYEARIADILSGRKVAVGGTGEAEAARRLRTLLDEQHDYVKAAGVDIGYVDKGYYPRVLDEDAVLKDPAAFKAKATELYTKMGLEPAEAAQNAEDWYSRVLGVTDGAYATGLPATKATKGRVLPKDADTILEDFYQKDPRANLTAYFRQTSQAAEFARRFGPNGEKAEALFNEMLKKGVPSPDVESVRHQFESAAGLLYSTRPARGAGALSWIQTAGVLRLLPRAVISSAVESLATGVRAHDVGAGFKAMADSYATVFGLKEADDVKTTAEMLGIIGDAMNDLVISANFGGEVGGQLQQKTLARFFKVTHLHQITEAQRLAATRVGQGFIRTLLSEVVTPGHKRAASATRLLKELGMDEAGAKGVATWLGSNEGKVPMGELLGEKPEARMYRTALQRFVDESIQNPTAADRPQFANHPYGRLAYGITSFMFSFTRNVLLRTVKEAGEGVFGKGYSLEDRARLLTPAIGLAVLTAAQSQVSEFREMLLNPGASDEKTKVQKVTQNMSRAGVFGNADPFINIALSARYNRDLTSSLTGPYLTAYLDSLAKMSIGLIPKKWGGPNSENTNNAEWQASKAAYEAIAAPLIAAAASYAPGGPLLRLGYGAGLVKATSPGASRGFADKVAGERDVKPRAQDVGDSEVLLDDTSDIPYDVEATGEDQP